MQTNDEQTSTIWPAAAHGRFLRKAVGSTYFHPIPGSKAAAGTRSAKASREERNGAQVTFSTHSHSHTARYDARCDVSVGVSVTQPSGAYLSVARRSTKWRPFRRPHIRTSRNALRSSASGRMRERERESCLCSQSKESQTHTQKNPSHISSFYAQRVLHPCAAFVQILLKTDDDDDDDESSSVKTGGRGHKQGAK